MPLFGKPSFKAGRKVPRRKADAGSADPSQLTDKQALNPNLDFSSTPLRLNLGGQSMLFQNGSWVPADDMSQTSPRGVGGSRDLVEMKDRIDTLEEENNMLKYKIELLLDMLAVSNCDLDCMEKELKMLKKTSPQQKDSGIIMR